MARPVPRAARRWIIICSAVLGGLILFSAGILLGRQQAGTRPPQTLSRSTRASPEHRSRNVYSPSVIADPHVLDEQRKLVEALESACAHQHRTCATARNARAYLDAHK